MAIYHCSIKTISRGAGQSIIASAAYRHACKLENFKTGEIHDYTRRQGLESSFICLPSGVNAKWATDRGQLWNVVEAAEKRVNSRLGRDIVIALPSELSVVQRRELAEEMGIHLADRYMVAVDVAIHQPSRHGDQRNYHAHLLMSSRRITAQSFGEKARELDDKERGPTEVEHIRTVWADMTNCALERARQYVRIDHRSLKAQGVDRQPTIHLGVAAAAMERRGVTTRIGDRNRSCTTSLTHKKQGTQEALEAQEWVLRREELRQKEKETEKEAEAFFERAAQYEGRNGLYEKMSFWEFFLFKNEKNIRNQAQAFHDFAGKCRQKGEHLKQEAKEYAEQGIRIALEHPETRNADDQLIIASLKAEAGNQAKRAEAAILVQQQSGMIATKNQSIDVIHTYAERLEYYFNAKKTQADKLELKLTNYVMNQKNKVEQVIQERPGVIASLWKGDAWERQRDQQRKRLYSLDNRLGIVRHFNCKDRLLAMAEKKLRYQEPELVASYNKEMQIRHAEKVRQQIAAVQKRQEQGQGIGLSLSRSLF